MSASASRHGPRRLPRLHSPPAMQSAMQMQNASRIFTVAPCSGLQQVIHSVEASCMRGEREWKMASPDGRAITLANNGHSRRAKVVKQGRSHNFGVLVRRSTRRAAAAAAACAASPATRIDPRFRQFCTQGQGSQQHSDCQDWLFQDAVQLDIDEDFVTPISNTGAEIEHLFPSSGDSRAQQEIPAHQEETEVEEITQSQVQNAREKRKGVSSRGKSFSTEEDKILCSGWLNISMDAVTGTNQSGNGFYRRLHQYFAENCGGNCSRSQNSIQNRWLTIQKAVSRFSAFYSAIERRNESGKNEQDRINEAVRMYQDKEVWNFGHCWDILRHEPKWNDKLLETPTTGRGKTKQPQNAPEDALQTQSVQAESSLPPRPQGRDNAKKRRAKGYAETSSSSPAVEMLQKMHERGQEIEEQDAKQKQELIDMEKERLELKKCSGRESLSSWRNKIG